MAEKQEEREKELWVANIFQISENIIIGSTEKIWANKTCLVLLNQMHDGVGTGQLAFLGGKSTRILYVSKNTLNLYK